MVASGMVDEGGSGHGGCPTAWQEALNLGMLVPM